MNFPFFFPLFIFKKMEASGSNNNNEEDPNNQQSVINMHSMTPNNRNRSIPGFVSHANFIHANSTDIPPVPSFLCRPYQPGLRSIAPSPMTMRGSPSVPGAYPPQHGTPYINRKPVARSNTKKVALFQGNLVLDCPVPTRLMEASARKDKEFSMMRYSAVTCDPNDFATNNYTLRPQLMGRETELFIVMTMYNVKRRKMAKQRDVS
jgi:hypothetical protein